MKDMNELEYENQGVENAEVQEPKKKSFFHTIQASFRSKKFKNGAYATTISAIVVVLVLVINLFVSEFDLKVDLSSKGIYTLTKDTKEVLKNVNDDITIFYLVQPGNEMSMYKEIIEKYESCSDKVHVEKKNPVLYPKFASKYVDNDVTENSVIVVNNKTNRVKYVDCYEMVETSMDYATMQPNIKGFDVEGQITSAIQYVSTEDLPVMYVVSGHGEASMSPEIQNTLKKQNVTVNTLETLTTTSIPKDCSMLLLNAPTSDYSEDEIDLIKGYLQNGGNAIIITGYTSSELINFNKLLQYYGVAMEEGMIFEADENHMVGQYPNILVPEVKLHDITKNFADKNIQVMVPNAVGIKQMDTKRSTLTFHSLLSTSNQAYSKVDEAAKTFMKEDGDIDGPFDLGVAIVDKYLKQESKVVVYSASQMFDKSAMSVPTISNLDMFANTVNYLSGEETTLSIRTIPAGVVPLSITSAQMNFWLRIVLFIIPITIIALGIVVCVKRRKK